MTDRAPRLVCLPHAGGSAGALPWRHLLPARIASHVEALELPGRGRRFGERCLGDLDALAADVAGALRALPGAGPLLLQGHSMGALVAYEVARLLGDDGAPVAGLILSGRNAPHLPRPTRTPPCHQLSDGDLLEELRQLGGTPAQVLADAELMALLLPMVRADFRAVETYAWRPGPALPLPAVILGGAADARVSRAGLEAWRAVISGPLQVEVWPGGHFFLHEAPERFAQLLAQAAEDGCHARC